MHNFELLTCTLLYLAIYVLSPRDISINFR